MVVAGLPRQHSRAMRVLSTIRLRYRRLVLAWVVAGGFVLAGMGAIAAWRDRDAAPLLGTGFALVVMGLYGDRVTDLVLKVGSRWLV